LLHSDLIRKYLASLKEIAKSKHASLFAGRIGDEKKKFYNVALQLVIEVAVFVSQWNDPIRHYPDLEASPRRHQVDSIYLARRLRQICGASVARLGRHHQAARYAATRRSTFAIFRGHIRTRASSPFRRRRIVRQPSVSSRLGRRLELGQCRKFSLQRCSIGKP